jgi:protein-tyrosine phosphatase
VQLLVVCTANQARSPLLAARLRMEADARPTSASIEISSAGTDALFGQPAAPGCVAVAERWGVDLTAHRACPLAYLEVEEVPMVLVFGRSHRRELAARYSSAAARTFRLRELSHIVATWDDEQLAELPDPADPERRLRAVAALADGHRPRWAGRRYDVADPIGQPQEVFDALGEEFVDEAAMLAPALFGPVTDPEVTDPDITDPDVTDR